jgi:hypothetical protein
MQDLDARGRVDSGGSDLYSMCLHDNPVHAGVVQMKWLSVALLAFAACFVAIAMGSAAQDTLAQNFTEHSWIFVNGYMDDSRVLQTDKGFRGSKMVYGASGSGIATRTIDSEVYKDSNMEEASMTISANYDYHPYVMPVALTQSDLRNALCAKNYEVGSVFSEKYTNIKDLIKDTTIYQNDNVSIYNINSEVQGIARIGSRVQKNANTVPSFIMGGTYIGYAQIRTEIQAGDISILNLPCP